LERPIVLMFPPQQQRGQPVSPSAFNALMDEVKSNQINSIRGGSFNRSIGGTSININSGTFGGGGGSGGASVPCPFQCTDKSTDDELRVQVSWGLIYQILPTGMVPNNDPPLQIVVTETCFIYSEIVFNTDTLMPTEVKFSAKTAVTSNTSTTQYNLIAVVTIDEDAEPKFIKNINNICQQPYPNPCALASQ
jgi:hypothetical protein